MVNGRRHNIASAMMKIGDVIELKEKSRQIPQVIEAVASAEREIPEYVTVDEAKFRGSINAIPELADVPYPVQMEPNLVIEYYSR
jgi:small subunit ribosomal protein S4